VTKTNMGSKPKLMPMGTAKYSNVNVDTINDKVFGIGISSTTDILIGKVKANNSLHFKLKEGKTY